MSLRDELASDAHDAWMHENARNGITTRLSSLTGEEQMVPFDQLSDAVKAYDYALVDVILPALFTRLHAYLDNEKRALTPRVERDDGPYWDGKYDAFVDVGNWIRHQVRVPA